MKLWKKLAIATFCLTLLASGPSVLAASDEQTIEETASQLMEEAENLNPDSAESVENLSRSLENWDTSATSSSSLKDVLSGIDLGPQESVQVMFYKLQQQQAQICKDEAQKYVEEIQKQQDMQTQYNDLIDQLRAFSYTTDANPQLLPDEIKQKLIDLDVCSEADSVLTNKVTKEDVDSLIEKVELLLENFGTSIQQNMIYVQDYIGQYNAYIKDSASAIAASTDGLTSTARGGTMLGGNMGMLFTGILIGACLGVIVVLVVQKSRKKES